MVNGKTNTINLGETYIKNLKTTSISRSFPASSLIYSQIDCKIKISMSITNTLRKVFKKVVSIYLSSSFKGQLIYAINVVIAVFLLVKSKQRFWQWLICFKRINSECCSGIIITNLDEFVYMLCVAVYT